jgi:hypothetical protein
LGGEVGHAQRAGGWQRFAPAGASTNEMPFPRVTPRQHRPGQNRRQPILHRHLDNVGRREALRPGTMAEVRDQS